MIVSCKFARIEVVQCHWTGNRLCVEDSLSACHGAELSGARTHTPDSYSSSSHGNSVVASTSQVGNVVTRVMAA